MDLFSFKELYDVYLKATYPIDIKGISFEPGETIAKFDKISVAGLAENVNRSTANGGWDNREFIHWESTKEMNLQFSQGVFSKIHFALLTNSKLFDINKNSPILITKTEEKESNENGVILLTETPKEKIFIYDKDSHSKIIEYQIDGNQITLSTPYTEVIVEYQYEYTNGGQSLKIGQGLIPGYLELEGRTRLKDDTTGQVVTGLIRIPKLKLMSDLSIRLGTYANPVAANFKAVGIPVGSKGDSHVVEFLLLNNDIDSDF